MQATSRNDSLLPEGARLLHIGPQKTGTTALQMALDRTRERLREQGVLVPYRGTRPRKASWSLLGTPDGSPRPDIEHWHALCREVRAAGDNRVVISTEDWARTDLRGALAVVDGVGGDRPHVVATARRLDKLLPSQWQQRVKMRRISHSYEEWLEIVLGDNPDDPSWQNLWRPHDIRAVTERWGKAAGGPQNFTLIIADESDRNLLPRVFEDMLGLTHGLLHSAATGGQNESMSYSRIDAIRRINRFFEEHHRHGDRDVDELHFRLVNVLRDEAPWTAEQRIPALPPWAHERVVEISEERVRIVRSLGVRVVGDPENLLPPPETQTPATSESDIPVVSTELAIRLAQRAIESSEEQRTTALSRHERQLKRLRRELAQRRSRTAVDDLSARALAQVIARRAARRLSRR